jgi:hypothetical protein
MVNFISGSKDYKEINVSSHIIEWPLIPSCPQRIGTSFVTAPGENEHIFHNLHTNPGNNGTVRYRWEHGSVVVKALCYKTGGRGFDTRCCQFLNLPHLSGSISPGALLSL